MSVLSALRSTTWSPPAGIRAIWTTVLSAIEDLPDGAAVNAAYDQMMPQDALGLPEIIRNMMNQYSGSVFDHMGTVRGSKQYAMLERQPLSPGQCGQFTGSTA